MYFRSLIPFVQLIPVNSRPHCSTSHDHQNRSFSLSLSLSHTHIVKGSLSHFSFPHYPTSCSFSVSLYLSVSISLSLSLTLSLFSSLSLSSFLPPPLRQVILYLFICTTYVRSASLMAMKCWILLWTT